jgi:hypothetical protein
MANNQYAKLRADAQQQESILVFKTIGIKINGCVLIQKSHPRFLERHAMLPLVRSILDFIPYELNQI